MLSDFVHQVLYLSMRSLATGFILLVIILFRQTICFAQQSAWRLQTEDTHISFAVNKGRLFIRSLQHPVSGHNWISTPSQVALPDSIEINGKTIAITWKFDSASGNKGELRFIFSSKQPAMHLVSTWQARPGPGPVRHTMLIANLSGSTITIHQQESLDVMINTSKYTSLLYISDDASWPDSIGLYTHSLSTPVIKDLKISEVQDWIPFVMMNTNNKDGLYSGWEWGIGRVRIDGNATKARIQMGSGDDFKTDLAPGETFQVPPAFIGTYTGDADDGSNRLRKYLFNYSMPALITMDSTYPKVEWNAFAATGKKLGSWDPVEAKYYPLIDDIAPLGFEEVVIDIGWWKSYGDPGHMITDSVDWPSGIPAAAKYAKDRQMRFGLYDNESEDLTTDSGKAERIRDISYLLDSLHADFYRSDATAGPIANGRFGPLQRAKYPSDIGYWAIKGFYEVMDTLYKNISGFSWENCSIGGGLKDFGSLSRCAKIQNQDVYYPIEARKAFYDASFALHPMQIASVVGSWEPWQAKGSLYEFRSASMGAAYWHPDGPSGLNGGPVWTDAHRAVIKQAVSTYKEKLRPLIRQANLYHIFPRPDNRSRDGIQYYDPATGKGVVYIFQPVDQTPSIIRLKGLMPGETYRLSFEDASQPPATMSGAALMNKGIMVQLKGDEASDLMFIERHVF